VLLKDQYDFIYNRAVVLIIANFIPTNFSFVVRDNKNESHLYSLDQAQFTEFNKSNKNNCGL